MGLKSITPKGDNCFACWKLSWATLPTLLKEFLWHSIKKGLASYVDGHDRVYLMLKDSIVENNSKV